MKSIRSQAQAIPNGLSADLATLIALLRQRAEGSASSLAYTFLLDGDADARSVTYGELDRRARALAATLQSRVPAGERALILVPPGLGFVAAFFGCLYAGLIAVPVPLPRRKRGLPRLLSIVRDSAPSVVLMDDEVLSSVGDLGENPALADLNNLYRVAIDRVPQGAEDRWRAPAVTDATVAFLQYTSGSTGVPKGVVLTHGNLLHNECMIQSAFAHTDQSVIVGWLPPYHDMGLIGNILQPLYVGAPCIQMAPQHFLIKPLRWLTAISRYRATTSGGPNFAYDLCVSKITPEQREGLDLRSWTVAFNGAEPVRAATMDRFAKVFAGSGFRRSAFYPCYGLAEATLLVSGGEEDAPPIASTVDRVELEQGRAVFVPHDQQNGVVLVGCGQPQVDEQVRVVHPETRQSCADGQVGEIWVSGANVAQGYWNRPEDTARTFEGRLVTGEGPFLRTGDLGFVSDGEIYVTGRLKDLMIIRGRNLYPQDIEITAEQSHLDLRAGGGAAFSVDLAGEERLVLVQEIADRAPEDLARRDATVRQAIADRHEVAVHVVVFIKPGSLPRTTSGKVQRCECRARFLDGSLNVIWQARPELQTSDDVEPAQTALETVLSGIWAEVLERSRVGRHEEFLSVGGDSLRAMQVSARVREACGVELNPAQLFESMTVAGLAAWIENRQASSFESEPLADLVPAARPERLPLSLVQERLWFLEQLVAGAPVYHIAAALRLTGTLDPRALDQAVTALVARHETLRTCFPSIDGRPVQRVVPPTSVELLVRDLGDHPEEERECALDDYLRLEARTPFDLAHAPPVRWSLIRVVDGDHVLALTCHHLVADGWSMTVILRELGRFYSALSAGHSLTLAPLPIQYADYTLWQRERSWTEENERQLAYWRERFKGVGQPLDFPADRPRPRVQSFAGAREEFALAPELVKQLTDLGRCEGVTLFATLATGLLTLLHRYTGQTDLCIGAPVAARSRTELEGVVGCFLNTLALRVDVSGDPRVTDLVARVRAAVTEAQANQDVPFERVLQELPLARDLGRSPLFQVMFSMQPPRSAPTFEGLGIATRQVDTGIAQFDLALDFVPASRGARAAWEYNTDLFEAATIRRLTERLRLVLEGMVARPESRLSELPLFTGREARPWLGESESAFSPPWCVHELFEDQVRRRPEAVALIHGDERLTYQAVNVRVNRLARRLRRLGVGPETRVGIYLDRSPDLVVSVLAVLKAGGGYVPLDPAQPADRVAFVLADAEVSVLVTREDLNKGIPSTRATVLCLDQHGWSVADENATNLTPPPAGTPTGTHDRLAYLIYTSGSTGRPKGVMVTHRTLANAFAAWQQVYQLPEGELRVLQLASPAFDVWTADWVRALCSGGALVLESHEISFDPAALAALVRREQITAMDVVPALVKPLMEEWNRQGQGAGGLRLLVVGSDTWPVRDYLKLREQCAPDTRLLSCYGVTESTIDSAWFEGTPEDPSLAGQAVPLGRPFPNTRLHVLDRYGQALPVGVPGELAIGGAGVARGYWRQPGLTAERFVPDLWSSSPGARLYRTGDRVRLRSDGSLEFLGRVDHQVKLRGLRIEPREIEECLGRHPYVREAVVVLKEDKRGEKRLVAYVVAAPDCAPESAKVKDLLRAHLPEAMIPSAIVWLGALPLSPNGKVDRSALPEPDEQPGGQRSAATLPRTDLERMIVEAWQEVLPDRQIGIHDNFFDLGGHSLLLAQIASRLREKMAREIPILVLFQYPTIASLAEALSQANETGPAPETGERDREQAQLAQQRRAALFARRRGNLETKGS